MGGEEDRRQRREGVVAAVEQRSARATSSSNQRDGRFDCSTCIRFLSFRTRNNPHQDTDPVPAVSELTGPSLFKGTVFNILSP